MSAAPAYERIMAEDVPVLLVREQGAPGEAGPRAFARLEGALASLDGRTLYGYWDPRTAEYHVCATVEHGDDPEALGLEPGVIRGGPYLRERLRGAPADIYPRIGPAFAAMEQVAGKRDASRHYVELYRGREEVDLLIPLAEASRPAP